MPYHFSKPPRRCGTNICAIESKHQRKSRCGCREAEDACATDEWQYEHLIVNSKQRLPLEGKGSRDSRLWFMDEEIYACSLLETMKHNTRS